MNLGLEGSGAVVTGGTKGMGRARAGVPDEIASITVYLASRRNGYVDLADDKARVVEVTPPECEYWMIAPHNHWMETLDYVRHQATLNCHTAQLEDDGSVRFVIAHRDPDVPNWLDTAGHQRGTVGVRWVGPDVVDVLPTTRVVELSSLSGGT